MKTADVLTILSAIVALASAVSEPALESVFPGHGAYISGVVALAGVVAGVLIRVLSNPTDAPAKTIVANAPVVSAVTGEQVATNISSTSELLPPKGP